MARVQYAHKRRRVNIPLQLGLGLPIRHSSALREGQMSQNVNQVKFHLPKIFNLLHVDLPTQLTYWKLTSFRLTYRHIRASWVRCGDGRPNKLRPTNKDLFICSGHVTVHCYVFLQNLGKHCIDTSPQ